MSGQMKPHLRAGLTLLLIFGLGGISGAEDLTITTYYPSPRGVYDQLRTDGETDLAMTSGNVGIGSQPGTPPGFPSQKLHIVGNGALPTNVWIDSGLVGQWVSLGANTPGKIDLAVGGVDLFINNNAGPGGGSTFINAGVGSVGIGLSTPPSAKLHIVSPAAMDPLRVDTATVARSLLVDKGGWVSIASNPAAPFELSVGGGILVEQGLPAPCPPPANQGGLAFNEQCYDTGIFSNADGELILYSNAGQALYIYSHPPARMTFTRDYPVGIGFTSSELPTARLHVFRGAAPESFRVDDTVIGDLTPFVIDGLGNVGIGTAAPAEKLDVAGNATVSGEATIGGVANDGTGEVVCIKADKTLGTCDGGGVPAPFNGTCLCN